MLLITELLDEKINFVTEETDKGKKLYIEGVFMQGGIPNKNGRIYPNSVLDKEVARYIGEAVEKSRAFGELGHPAGPTVNLDRVSHLIKSLHREGNNYIGKALIMESPMGNIVKSLLEGGASLGVSSRGMGSIKEGRGGIMEVQADFHLATAADIVADPSAPDAFVRGIMEGCEWVYDVITDQWKKESISEIHESMKKLTVKQIEESKLRLFGTFLKTITKNL